MVNKLITIQDEELQGWRWDSDSNKAAQIEKSISNEMGTE